MDFDVALMQQDLSHRERVQFQMEYNQVRKNPTTGILLTLFLGGIGGHHYYMGKVVLGVVYTLLCWTFVPALVAFVEMFLISKRIRTYNMERAREIAYVIESLRSDGAPAGD